MPNIIEYAPIFQGALDLQMLQQATSGWMGANAGQVRYTGGNEVKIPVHNLSGLGDYDRAGEKYPDKGGLNLSYQTFVLTQDRAAGLSFDRHDVDGSNFIINARMLAGEMQRTRVIPEVGASRYPAIAARVMAAGKSTSYAPQASTVINQSLTGLNNLRDRTGDDLSGLVAAMAFPVYGLLARSAGLGRSLTPQTFTQGGLSFEVKPIDGVPTIPVVSGRMKGAYIFHAGNAGDPDFGFGPDGGAVGINWTICPRPAPIAVSKTDNIKIFTPDENQGGDSWMIKYRKYHGLWVKRDQLDAFEVSVPA
jgi:hypothetical protein